MPARTHPLQRAWLRLKVFSRHHPHAFSFSLNVLYVELLMALIDRPTLNTLGAYIPNAFAGFASHPACTFMALLGGLFILGAIHPVAGFGPEDEAAGRNEHVYAIAGGVLVVCTITPALSFLALLATPLLNVIGPVASLGLFLCAALVLCDESVQFAKGVRRRASRFRHRSTGRLLP